MIKKNIFRYKGYSLRCKLIVAGGKTLNVHLSILTADGDYVREKAFPERFGSEAEAIQAARHWGMGWVNDQ